MSTTPAPPPTDTGDTSSRPAEIAQNETHNLAVLAAITAVTRVGWIFKTESVIIPAFLDAIAGPGWLRGLLPVLNRIGQSLLPFLFARRLKLMPRKQWALALANLSMGASFLVITAALWAWAESFSPWAFLSLYTLFFCATGVHMLSLGTLQGKLIRPDRRGRLLAIATLGGSIPAIGFAWWLLPGWLDEEISGYAKIFCFTGCVIGASGVIATFAREPSDAWEEPRASVLAQLGSALKILRRDADYRRLVIVSVLFTSSLILLPHYQSLGRERLGLQGGDMMLWIVSQNIAVGLSSVVMGTLADRLGNRLSVRIVIFTSALIPPLALALSLLPPDRGRPLFTIVFIGIGLTPIGLRLLSNYVLELAPEQDHPRYLSIAQICTAAMLCSSPFFGLLVDVIGFEIVFCGITALMMVGGLLTFGLVEPRSRIG